MADLTDADKAVLAVMLREAIAADARFPHQSPLLGLKVHLRKICFLVLFTSGILLFRELG
jgi:hypothetical protein